MRAALLLGGIALLACATAPATAHEARRDDNSEQRVRNEPPRFPAVRAWVLDGSGAAAIAAADPPRTPAEKVQQRYDLALARAEAESRQTELDAAGAAQRAAIEESTRQMMEANEAAQRKWREDVAANKIACRKRPNRPCPQIARPADIAGGFQGVMIGFAVAPFQVQLRYADSPQLEAYRSTQRPAPPLWQVRHKCGGGLIDTDWVLTAAHCASADQLADGLEVRLGTNDIAAADGGVVRKVVEVIRHPAYDPGNMYANDIALLRLAPGGVPLGANAPSPFLDLATSDPAAGTKVFVPGWGLISDANAAPVAILRRYPMEIVAAAQCAALPGFAPRRVGPLVQPKIHPGVMCAGGGGVKTCEGDSGGPLVIASPESDGITRSFRVVGIVSWNKRTCDTTRDPSPGVYTSVAAYADWIRKTMSAPRAAAR